MAKGVDIKVNHLDGDEMERQRNLFKRLDNYSAKNIKKGKWQSKIPDLLMDKVNLVKAKEKEYGHTYLQFGKLWMALFPNGFTIKTEEQANVFGVFHMLVHKMLRLAGKLEDPAHVSIDSAKDMQVYAAMMEELLLMARGELK